MSNENNQIKWKSGCNNSVVLTDFELFQPNETDRSITDRSITDRIVGTAGWAPPEQWCPEKPEDGQDNGKSSTWYVYKNKSFCTSFFYQR